MLFLIIIKYIYIYINVYVVMNMTLQLIMYDKSIFHWNNIVEILKQQQKYRVRQGCV